MKTPKKIKYVSDNGIFYIDHANHGTISVDESSISNSEALIEDINVALEELRMSKKMTENRILNIKGLLNE